MLQAQEHGRASYYSNRLHGRRMSDGTRYHRDSLVCAHRRYPLGTMLKVTNIKNGKSVIVRVADRCGRHRIIDLSYAAAKEIGLISSGVSTVRVERHVENKGVPYKQEPELDLPELDYEVTEGQPDGTPQWFDKKSHKEHESTTEANERVEKTRQKAAHEQKK